jgi:hypothetical protein
MLAPLVVVQVRTLTATVSQTGSSPARMAVGTALPD